jgi:antitoxin YefM
MQTIPTSATTSRASWPASRRTADYTAITRRDAQHAAVMSIGSFDSLMETVHLLESRANAAQLARSVAQHRAGATKAPNLIDG